LPPLGLQVVAMRPRFLDLELEPIIVPVDS
jgi:hypothetical protein